MEFPGILYLLCLCFALSNTSSQYPCTLDICVFLLYARKVQCGMKLNPRNLITLNTCTYANGTVYILCMCVSVCMRAVIFPCELRWFCAVAFTYSFSFCTAPHLLVWPSPHPTQPLTQRAMFPRQFPMGYESYSVEQRQGVYVCVCLCGGTRCGCVISLTWQCKSHVVWSTLVHLTSGRCSNTKPQTC